MLFGRLTAAQLLSKDAAAIIANGFEMFSATVAPIFFFAELTP